MITKVNSLSLVNSLISDLFKKDYLTQFIYNFEVFSCHKSLLLEDNSCFPKHETQNSKKKRKGNNRQVTQSQRRDHKKKYKMNFLCIHERKRKLRNIHMTRQTFNGLIDGMKEEEI